MAPVGQGLGLVAPTWTPTPTPTTRDQRLQNLLSEDTGLGQGLREPSLCLEGCLLSDVQNVLDTIMCGLTEAHERGR